MSNHKIYNVVLMGTPEFSVDMFEEIINNDNFKVLSKKLITLSNQTRETMNDPADKERIDTMQEIAAEYNNAADNYAESLYRQNELRDEFVQTEENLITEVEQLEAAQRTEYEEVLNNSNSTRIGSSNNELERKIESVLEGQHLIERILLIGQQERNYIINLTDAEKQEEYANSTLESFATAEEVALDLKSLFKEEKDIKAVESILVSLKNTENKFKEIHSIENGAWVVLDGRV
jgi:hypothetical protein